jgi:uncharacterized protein YigE (DUF2233 family)
MISRRLAYPCAVTLLCLAICGPTHAESCRSESFKGASYIVCSFNPTTDNLRFYWRADDGKPYRTFSALAAGLKAQDKSLKFAMNGGMYQADLSPVGLYIEHGRELIRANTATRAGVPSQIPNFYKKPNGVFFIGDREAGILETGRFLADRPQARFATQSGPMLVIDGALHPAFIVNSNDRKPRNGLAIVQARRIVPISACRRFPSDFSRERLRAKDPTPPGGAASARLRWVSTLGSFALFRDDLGCSFDGRRAWTLRNRNEPIHRLRSIRPLVRASCLDTRATIADDGGRTTSLFGIVAINADVSTVDFNTYKSLLEGDA